MKIKYWSAVLKEKNSTFQPSGGVEIDVKLKENTSLMNPVFIIIKNISEQIRYVYWEDTFRYYFVDDVVSITNSISEIHCSVDVLATYKTQIGQSSQYILRSASQSDPYIIDRYYPAKVGVETVDVFNDDNWGFYNTIEDGRFVLGIQGKGTNGLGGCLTYYVMTNTQAKAVMQYLLGDASFYSISDITAGLTKAIFNPIQYVSSCMWFPFRPDMGSAVSNLEFGWWDLSISGDDKPHFISSSAKWNKFLAFTIPKHPLTVSRGRWLNSSPFTKLYLNAPAFGQIEIDPSIFIDETKLYVYIDVDVITGTGTLAVICQQGNNNVIIDRRYAQIGVPVQVGQNSFNPGAITGLVTTMGALAAGSITAAASVTGIMGTIGNALDTQVGKTSSVSSNGTIINYSSQFELCAEFMTPCNEDITNIGRPLCQTKTVNTLSGFMTVQNPHINSYALDAEREMIDAFMRNGFYYE